MTAPRNKAQLPYVQHSHTGSVQASGAAFLKVVSLQNFGLNGSTAMLLVQTSSHCQSSLPSKFGFILFPVKAFELLHHQGLSRFLPLNCSKTTLLRIKWRQGNHVLPCRKGSDGNARRTRYINAVLAMEPGTTYDASHQATVNHTLMSTNNSEQFLTASSNKRELLMFVETIQNQSFLPTAKASAGSSLLGRLNPKDVEKQIQEEKETARRRKISKANKGRTPWNKGKRGDCKTVDKDTTLQTEVKAIKDEEKETLRRQRISQANRGKVPWNKGGKHSSETKKRIRAGVIERMKDPKIREKLRLQAEAVQMSPEVKFKIRTGIIRAWKLKQKLKAKQDLCLREWKEVVAEAARRGYEGDVEYQWDSCSILRKQARAAVPRKKRESYIKPDHLSVEHRLRISAAIKAKWSEPDYRISVEKGIRSSVSKRVMSSTQRRPRAEPRRTFTRPLKRTTTPQNKNLRSNGDFVSVASDAKVTQKSTPKASTQKPSVLNSKHVKDLASVTHVTRGSLKGALRTDLMESDSPKVNADVPAYRDPEAEKKLEKLKSMRARRMHMEVQYQKEITERARFLISQAQEAAKALEAAAVKDKNAIAPLLETRKLLAEAVHSLEFLNKKSPTSDYIVKENGFGLYAQVMSLANAVSSPLADVGDHSEWESSSVESSNLHT